jgi:tight adherence protein C
MDWVQLLTNPDNVIAGAVGLITFAAIITVISPAFQQSGLESRLKSVANRREELRRRSREALAGKQGAPSLRRTDEGIFKRVNEQLQLSRLLEDSNLTDKLAQAGFRGPSAISRFYVFRLILPIVLAAGAAIYVFGLNGMNLPVMQKIAACVAGLVAGYYAPNLYISNVATKRRESIVNVFPDALDLLLICVESGMSIESAFTRVAGEIGSQSAELAEELALTTAELSYLPDRRQAFDNLAKRCGHAGVKAVATALNQAEKYGTPLGQALRVTATENREMRMQEAERKAASLPAKLTVPMILFFLPALFIVILGPAIIQIRHAMH